VADREASDEPRSFRVVVTLDPAVCPDTLVAGRPWTTMPCC
jgi:hypothetical protein